jgi:hypothetical protein
MIAPAASQAWAARSAALGQSLERARARRRVGAIDEMLDVLERMHLNRDRVIDSMIRCRLRRLEQEVGLPMPRQVVRARNTVRLHAALLDWQDEVLDQVFPWRRALLASDEVDDPADPVRRIA